MVTAVTSVDSSGFPDAAVPTGTLDIASKLPGLAGSVGTAAHPAPNCAPVAPALEAIGSGAVVLVIALAAADIDWTPARALLVLVTPVAGGIIFGAVFVATCTIGFHVVEGMEFANALTYGGNYLSSLPFTIFGTFIRRFFTFVVPAAFVAYLPTLALLGRSDPAGLPTWTSWSAPAVRVGPSTPWPSGSTRSPRWAGSWWVCSRT